MNDPMSPSGEFSGKFADAFYYYVTNRRKAGDTVLRRIEGTSAPGGPPLDGDLLEQKAFELISDQKWTDALSIYLLLLLTKRSSRYWWAIGKLLWRITWQPELESYVDACGPRVSAHFTSWLGVDCERLKTKQAKVGYSSVKGYEHTIQIGKNGETRKIYERISEALDVTTAIQESNLFSLIEATALSAPNYYGFSTSEQFVSSYYEFVEGEHLEERDWWAIEEKLLAKFWSVPVPEILRSNKTVNLCIAEESIREFSARLTKVDLTEYFQLGELEDITRVIVAQSERILNVIERAPRFVYHLDFHRGNVLVDNAGHATVLDWERFSIEPIGFGWRPFSPDRIDEIELDPLRDARILPLDFKKSDLLLMACLWGFYNATERANAKLTASWVRSLVNYSVSPNINVSGC